MRNKPKIFPLKYVHYKMPINKLRIRILRSQSEKTYSLVLSVEIVPQLIGISVVECQAKVN